MQWVRELRERPGSPGECHDRSHVGHLPGVVKGLRSCDDEIQVLNRIPLRVRWLVEHLVRQMTTSQVPLPEADCVARIVQAIEHRSPLSADRETRRQLTETGFVTGTVQGVHGSVSLRLKCYRPQTWMGRLGAVFGDHDKLAKPVLSGKVSGGQRTTQVSYRVDAFGTAVSALLFFTLGLVLVVSGVIVSLVHPMPMPSIGSVLLIPGVMLLVFFLLIFGAVESAMLDEQYLTDWLLATLG